MAKQLAEVQRIEQSEARTANWKRWGPYLSERQWGTVREDYSPDGDCWRYFPHDQARSRAYRWGEDGLLGLCDRECRLCFAPALWNGNDPILKERLFGLTNPEGNHGEDVKEQYFYLDSAPSHAYMSALYKYPQRAFPYDELVRENRRRGRAQEEFEITDTGAFDDGRYFDVFAEYAKRTPNDVLVRLTIVNRGPDAAALDVLPTLWFRNTWSWGRIGDEGHWPKPTLKLDGDERVAADHASLGTFTFHARAVDTQAGRVEPTWLFTENETNNRRLFNTGNESQYVKDGFHDRVVHDDEEAVNPAQRGTKCAPWYRLQVNAGETVTIDLRLHASDEPPEAPFDDGFDECFDRRRAEADAFYQREVPDHVTDTQRNIIRQSYAGLLWSKQFYHYVVEQWLNGDPGQPAPPPARASTGRNRDWHHFFSRDVLSMPDKWEYPWFAAWDLAFHMIPMARIDPEFTKKQLTLMLREWYMHPSGALPAYEFHFSDVNPPVHAWACWRAYKICGPRGCRDRQFLERTFQKLLLNFTWWVNQKDRDGNHVFAGGFLGLDNIGVFDRSRPLDSDAHLEQADGTAWMAFYCGTMLSMALELAEPGNAYEDLASKFFEHYVHIADAINRLGGTGLWDPQDGFYYDQLHVDHTCRRMRVRSMVGLIPLIAVEVIRPETFQRLPGFRKRTEWFVRHRPELAQQISYLASHDKGQGPYLLAIPSRDRLERMLRYMLDENELLSPFGIRSLSRYHGDNPFELKMNGEQYRVRYEPGESESGLFGGNSNWRGPVWMPINYLIIEALERYHHFYGQALKVECPTGSGRYMHLGEVANELRRRLVQLFLPDEQGRRPAHGDDQRFANDPHWRDLVLFYEYFHGETGRGLGASHQTGWTALVSQCIRDPSRE